MPIYEYQCKSCNKQYESLVLGADHEDPSACPQCGSRDVQKLMSSASVVRSPSQRDSDRTRALAKVDPTKPQDVARHLKEHGSRFGDADFRGKKAWRDAVDRVAEGGPTLEKK